MNSICIMIYHIAEMTQKYESYEAEIQSGGWSRKKLIAES